MSSNVNSDDYYAVLGVPRGCGDAELKRAYKKLALRWHPDKNPNNRAAAEDSFKRVSEAYDVLSDPAKRRTYDQFGKQGFNMPSPEDDDMGGGGTYFSQGGRMPGGSRVFTTSFGGGGGGGRGGNFHFRSADEIFREFFGGRNPFAELEEELFGGMMGGMGGARGGGPGGMSVGMRGGFGGGGMRSLFDDPFFSDMGGMGMGGGMMQSNMGGGGGGTSFQSFSSSSMGGMSGGTSQSVQSTTRIENGRQVTRTTYTTRDANGNVTTRTEESVNGGGGGGGGGGGMLGFNQQGGGMQMQSMQMNSPGSRGGGFGFRMGF